MVNTIFTSFFFSTLTFAQNLVPNPSFETFSSCPNNYNQVSRATGWFPSSNNNNPTYHTEYCNACGTSLFQVPANTWGNQVAATGVGYMAEVTMDPGSQQDYRENIYAQLTSPLIIGNTYYVSFNISHTDNSQYASNNFGVKFATVPNFPINNICQVYSANIITDKINWTTISGCFVADSAYKFICLGNFFTDTNTLTQQSCPGCQWPLFGYYLDDVSVTTSSSNVFISGNTTICMGNSSTLTANGGNAYQWSTGATTSSIIVSPSSNSTYSVVVTDTSTGCSGNATTLVVLSNTSLDPGNSLNICMGDSAQLNAGGNATSYSWSPVSSLSNPNIASPIAFPSTTTTYTITGTNSFGCFGIDSQIVFVYPAATTPTISVNGNILASSSASSYQWYINGNPISGAISQYDTATQSGFYQVMITDANGCTAISAPYNFTFNGILENNSEIPFSISPNPNDGFFDMNAFFSVKQEIIITITSQIGQFIKEEKITASGSVRKKYDFRYLHKGVYFISIKTLYSEYSQKFIVE